MRAALAFLFIVLSSSAGLMYALVWSAADGPSTAERAARTDEATESESLFSLSNFVPGAEADAEPAAATAPEAEASFYRYIDERGSLHFAESLGEIPAAQRDGASKMGMSVPIQLALAPPTRRARRARPRAALDQVWGGDSVPSGPVIIYTTRWCGYCRKAMAHLDELGVDYVNKDIEDDPDAEAEYLEKSGGRRGVPLIDVGGQIMQGYSRRSLDRLLEKLG